MATYKEKLFTERTPSVLLLGYQGALKAMGLKIVSQERFKLVGREVPMQSDKLSLPITIEVKVAPLSEGTGLELTATTLTPGPIENDRVRDSIAELQKFFDKEMDKPNIEAERQAKIRAREEREAEERAKEAEEDARLDAIYQEKLAKLKAEEEAAKYRRLPAGKAEADTLERETTVRSGPGSTVKSTGSSSVGTASLSDELQKLADLYNDGILDDEEFKAAKRALINR